MAVKDINLVVADNLRHWMTTAEPPITQAALADKAGVAQKTISNYLNPEQRTLGANGKQGSPKLFELDLIAKALKIEVWQLTRDMSEHQRAAYEMIEKAYRLLADGAPPPSTSLSEAEEAEVASLRNEMRGGASVRRKRRA